MGDGKDLSKPPDKTPNDADKRASDDDHQNDETRLEDVKAGPRLLKEAAREDCQTEDEITLKEHANGPFCDVHEDDIDLWVKDEDLVTEASKIANGHVSTTLSHDVEDPDLADRHEKELGLTAHAQPEAPSFEHPNNFLLLSSGRVVKVTVMSPQQSLATNMVQCTKRPLSALCPYFRTKVEAMEQGNFVLFGLTCKCLPGAPAWTADRSVRYHSNDGGVYNGGRGAPTHHPYGVGDTVTCRLDYVGPDRSLINFLLDDRMVYRQWVNLPPDQLYATVGVAASTCQLDVEWPQAGRGDVELHRELTSNWFGWKGISRNDESQTFTLTEADTSSEKTAYNVQCPLAFGTKFHYYEVQLLSKGAPTSGPGIGLVSGNCDDCVYPGWTPGSVGYHSDDGGLYGNGQQISISVTSTCDPGDRMGCGVLFPEHLGQGEEREPVLLLAYFTKNRQLTYTRRIRQPRGGSFPCIAMNATGDAVKLDLACSPPDLERELRPLLTGWEASEDYRHSPLFALSDLSLTSATVRMTSDTEAAQLLQYRLESLRELGDGFCVTVTELGRNTEMQLGVSTDRTRLEGEFLGADGTTCGYMLRLGTIVSGDGMRAVQKWDPHAKQKIGCHLDCICDKGAVLCFTINDRLIGRGVVTRETEDSALYASVVISSGPAEVRVDWSGIVYSSTRVTRTQTEAKDWIRPPCIEARSHTLTFAPASHGYTFAASAQSCVPLVTGTSMFSVKILSSGPDLPGIGLSRATYDVSSVLGSETGEICFVPSGRHILANNAKKKVSSTLEVQAGDVLQCGVVFSASRDRLPQKVVVFFAVNRVILYHCVLGASLGGLYPTVAFSSAGGSVEIVQDKTELPLPDIVRDALTTDSGGLCSRRGSDDDVNVPAVFFSNQRRRSSSLKGLVSMMEPTAAPVPGFTFKIYASHAFADHERVDNIMKQLVSSQPHVAVETSTSRASMEDKNEALARADLAVLFVDEAYYGSHEMLSEYSGVICSNGLSAVLCALENTAWPPTAYFQPLQDELSKLPWVELTLTEGGRPSIAPLERYVEKKLHEVASSYLSYGNEAREKRGIVAKSAGHTDKQNLHHCNGSVLNRAERATVLKASILSHQNDQAKRSGSSRISRTCSVL